MQILGHPFVLFKLLFKFDTISFSLSKPHDAIIKRSKCHFKGRFEIDFFNETANEKISR